MAMECTAETKSIECPFCGSEAVYRYGKAKTGKQRYLCLMCERQFTNHPLRVMHANKPSCPQCGKVMHLYKNEPGCLRFRCCDYPQCRSFRKLQKKEIVNEPLHS